MPILRHEIDERWRKSCPKACAVLHSITSSFELQHLNVRLDRPVFHDDPHASMKQREFLVLADTGFTTVLEHFQACHKGRRRKVGGRGQVPPTLHWCVPDAGEIKRQGVDRAKIVRTRTSMRVQVVPFWDCSDVVLRPHPSAFQSRVLTFKVVQTAGQNNSQSRAPCMITSILKRLLHERSKKAALRADRFFDRGERFAWDVSGSGKRLQCAQHAFPRGRLAASLVAPSSFPPMPVLFLSLSLSPPSRLRVAGIPGFWSRRWP